MTNATPFLSIVAPALASALDALGRPDDATLVRRAEWLFGELMKATGERRVTLRAELTGLAHELGGRARALVADASLTADGLAYLAREVGIVLDTKPPVATPPGERSS